MSNSIQQFNEFGIKEIEKLSEIYQENPTKIAEYIEGITSVVVEFGLSLIAEEWNSFDDILHEKKKVRPDWQVVRTDEATLGTSLGQVRYHKTLFKNKITGERKYLLDDLLGIEPHARMTEDAEARILTETVESSYKKGGSSASISDFEVSKQTVMNKLRVLRFPTLPTTEEKRKASILYIDADEDHVSLQYLNKKGDILDSRANTYMPKIAYVYEGTEEQTHRLVNVRYFGGGYDGTKGVDAFWKEIYDYIEDAYDPEVLEKIYISGDGAGWIAKGAGLHAKASFVLDKFHLHKYIVAATSHLLDSKEEVRSEIWHAIYGKNKKEVNGIFAQILAVTDTETRRNAVENSKNYILSHWSAIMRGVDHREDGIHCSAEGHVSHVYADRMSSRPMGWSKNGADQMARLRIYYFNGGNMLELVRFQKQELPLAAGCEEMSAAVINESLNRNKRHMGKIAELPSYSIPYPQIRKMAAIRNHIWGL